MASKKSLLSADPFKRKQSIFHLEDGKTYVETRQDVSHLTEAAKVLAEAPPEPESGLRFVCYIPDTVFNQAAREGWLHDKDAWRKWARDRDNRQFNGGRENPF